MGAWVALTREATLDGRVFRATRRPPWLVVIVVAESTLSQSTKCCSLNVNSFPVAVDHAPFRDSTSSLPLHPSKVPPPAERWLILPSHRTPEPPCVGNNEPRSIICTGWSPRERGLAQPVRRHTRDWQVLQSARRHHRT